MVDFLIQISKISIPIQEYKPFDFLYTDMKKLQIKLENCYGIKKIEKEFNFSQSRAFAIYAPNGVMKSSFAKTFSDLSMGKKPSDLMYTSRNSVFEVRDENGSDIKPEKIFVIKPYDSEFKSEKISTLLASKELRDRYDIAHAKISQFKKILLEGLAELSGLSEEESEQEILFAFKKNNFFEFLGGIDVPMAGSSLPDFSRIKFKNIFTGKAGELLRDIEFRAEIQSYISSYNDLVNKSKYFKKGFNHYNAESVQKILKTNGFFKAGHSINLLNNESLKNDPIINDKELSSIIDNEKKTILSDLSSKWAVIDKKVSNEELRSFREYLSGNPEILSELENPEEFSKKIWLSYLIILRDLCSALLSEYREVKVEIAEILKMADMEKTAWHDAIEIFKKRFFVPFNVSVDNRSDVLLNQSAPAVTFTFSDGGGEVATNERDLLTVLSTGEKKALYILNIIFEVRGREKSKLETIFIVDDIADSFDYKNKYAIIQYLEEVSRESYFSQIILTHNFVEYDHCLVALKSESEIKLVQLEGINNIFVNDWIKHLDDPKKFIATVPFVRNLIEYTKGGEDQDYMALTSVLHWNSLSENLLISSLGDIYYRMFGVAIPVNPLDKIVELIFLEAEDCLSAAEGLNFENKIVLSIAIRLKAEEFMLKKINNPAHILPIKTAKLYDEFIHIFPAEKDKIAILEQVILITPENIHLNSFMYEPIIDMSDFELRRLLNDIKKYLVI